MMNAREVLGLQSNATDEEIRAAYIQKVKEFPPDRSPAEFEQVRDAYEKLRDPRRRIREWLFSANPATPFATTFAFTRGARKFVGADLWMAVIRGK